MILRGVWRLRGKTSKMEFYLNWKKVSQHFIQPALTSDSAFYHFSHTRSAAMWLSVFSEYMLYGKRLQADDLFLKGHNLIFTPHYDGEDLLHVSGFFFKSFFQHILHLWCNTFSFWSKSHLRMRTEHMTTNTQRLHRDNFASLFPFGKPLESRWRESMLFLFCHICSVMEWSMICTLITMNYSYPWL